MTWGVLLSDVAISYASAQREVANDILRRLEVAGRSVWIDELSRSGAAVSDINVPVGQQHWTVIAQALDDALLVLILDSPDWRRSEYCRREYAHAIARGKRVSVVSVAPRDEADGPPLATFPVTGLDDLIERFDKSIDVVRAHDRLLRASLARRPDGRRKVWSPISRLVGDIERVSLAREGAGIRITDELRQFSSVVQACARRRRNVLTGSGAGLVGVVILLTVVALVARAAGIDARRRAVHSAAEQSSLRLAQESNAAETTADRLAKAQQAVAASPTPAAVAAARTATSEAAGLQRLQPIFSSAYAMGLSDDTSTLVLGAGDTSAGFGLQRVDLRTGTVSSRIDLDTSTMAWMTAVGPDASWAVFADPRLTRLSLVVLGTGQVRSLVDSFSAFTVDNGGALWWVAPDLKIHRMADVHDPKSAQLVATADGHVTALSVDSDGRSFSALLATGDLVRFDGARAVERTALLTGLPTGYGADDRTRSFAPDLLLHCGSSYVAFRAGAWAAATNTGIVRSSYGVTSLGSQASALNAPSCVGDSAARISIRPPLEVMPASGWIPVGVERDDDGAGRYVFATDRSGAHLAVARPSGSVDVFTLAHRPRQTPVGAGYFVVPLGAGSVVIDQSGAVSLRLPDGSSRSLGTLGRINDQVQPAVVGKRLLVATGGGLALVDDSGIVGTSALKSTTRFLARQGDGVILATDNALIPIADLDHLDGLDRRAVVVQGLKDNESIQGAAVGAEGQQVFIATNFGRILVVDERSGAVLRSREVSPALTPLRIVTAPGARGSTRVVSYGGDGAVKEFTAALDPVHAAPLPGQARILEVAPDGSSILAANTDGRIVLLERDSLRVVQELATGRASTGGYHFTADSRTVVGTFLKRFTDSSMPGGFRYDDQVEEIPIARP